jgi:hypothetical protein
VTSALARGNVREALMRYLAVLVECLDATHHANDRPLYEKYIVDAARIVGVLEQASEPGRLFEAVRSHERLWGHSWLAGPEYPRAYAAWRDVNTQLEGFVT